MLVIAGSVDAMAISFCFMWGYLLFERLQCGHTVI